MKLNNAGFSLIELLAVSLILAILTSIALPQYRRSVQRAETIEAMTNLRSLFDSAKRYKSFHSETPTKLKGLDISFFDASTDDGDFDIGKFHYVFDSANNRIRACRNDDGNTTTTYCINAYYKHPKYGLDTMTCSWTSGGKFDWVCPAIGKTQIESTNEYILS